MIINIQKDYDGEDFSTILCFHYKKLAEKVVETVLDLENCPFEAEVDLTLTGDETIREINRENRDMDKVTDVLSFPMFQYPTPADFDAAEADPFGAFDPDNGHLMLGDIIINVRRVLEQAENYGHSRKREYAFLIAHSVLHLIGYDHMTPEEAAVMEAKQEAALKILNITREVET
ncbi:MAG: rRNA maturation RNase YbeY [Lachnospiraceae bacterium]|nr:rRNA maturation RNase YbeY [Lachnospiraceae bacterium]